ncbi:MAG: hypothetical protein V4651_06830 [Bacteroidota bacterium]
MKKFGTKIVVIFLPVIFFLLVMELYISSELAKGKRYYLQADWHDLRNHHSDVLFIGNSRMRNHINPGIIDEATGKKAEIIGQDGQDMHFMWLKFKEYERNNKRPEVIFLQFDPFFLNECKDLFGFDNYRTGFYMNRIDFTSLHQRIGYLWFYEYLPLAAIDIYLFIRVLFSLTIPADQGFEYARGSQIIQRKWEGRWDVYPQIEVKTESVSNYLDSFAIYCKQHNIQLNAIYTPQSYPSYKEVKNVKALGHMIMLINRKYAINMIFNNYNSPQYNDSTLFHNHMHLNQKGVNVFMKQFLDSTILGMRTIGRE